MGENRHYKLLFIIRSALMPSSGRSVNYMFMEVCSGATAEFCWLNSVNINPKTDSGITQNYFFG